DDPFILMSCTYQNLISFVLVRLSLPTMPREDTRTHPHTATDITSSRLQLFPCGNVTSAEVPIQTGRKSKLPPKSKPDGKARRVAKRPYQRRQSSRGQNGRGRPKKPRCGPFPGRRHGGRHSGYAAGKVLGHDSCPYRRG